MQTITDFMNKVAVSTIGQWEFIAFIYVPILISYLN
jgi:hypothetical protein